MGENYVILMASGCLLVFALGQICIPKRTEVNIVLCLLMLVCFVWISHGVGFRFGMLDAYPHLNKAHVPFLAATGPLWYLYIRIMVSGKGWSRGSRKHLITTIVSFLLAIPFFLQPESFKREYVEVNVTGFVTLTIYLATRLAELSAVIYPIMAYLKIRESRQQKFYSILSVLTLAAIFAALARFAGSVFGNHTVSVLLPIAVILTAFIAFYCLGNRHPKLMALGIRSQRVKNKTEVASTELEDYRNLLRENQWHLNPDLKIQEIARRLSKPVHDLSALINQQSAGNFKHFINKLRIEHSKTLLLDGTNRPMLDIAHESGFNSVSVFYEQFKKFESMPPATYRRSACAKEESVLLSNAEPS